MPPRLVIAHGHRLLAEALRPALERDFEVVGVVTSADALRELLAHEVVNTLLLDLALPGCHGVGFTSEVRMLFRELEVVVLTEFPRGGLAPRCLAAGASRVVSADSDIEELRLALAMAGRSDRHVSEPASALGRNEVMRASQLREATFTRRQQEVFDLLGEGRSCAEISRLLHLARSTITLHKRSLMRKLGIVAPSSLLRMAVLARLNSGSSRLEHRGRP